MPRESRRQGIPWGDELEPGGEHRMYVWQGSFPSESTRADGYFGTLAELLSRRRSCERIAEALVRWGQAQ
jgi:hypothetical protein